MKNKALSSILKSYDYAYRLQKEFEFVETL